MCLGVFLLGSSFFGTLWASWTSWKFISFARLGKFSFIIFSNNFSICCSSSSPSGTPMIQMLERLKMSWRFLSLSSHFMKQETFLFLDSQACTRFTEPHQPRLNSCFFILFWLNVSFFLLLQTIDLSPGFLPVTVGSLYIFLYFTFHTFHFSSILQPYSKISVSILITRVLNFASDRLAISLSLSCIFSGALICSFIWAFFFSLPSSLCRAAR